MSGVMVCLVGHQPVPNLLPIYHLKPKHVVLAVTEAPDIQRVANNLQNMLNKRCNVLLCTIPAYDVSEAQERLTDFLAANKLSPENLWCNITGGTKPMALAATLLAQKFNASIYYLESERNRSLLYHYRFEDGVMRKQDDPVEITLTLPIADFLNALGLENTRHPGNPEQFEARVAQALRGQVDEILCNTHISENVEIDIIMRMGNQLGIAEVGKQVKSHKDKIDQLNSAGSRFGTYTKRFLIVSNQIKGPNQELVRAYHITPVELLQSGTGGIEADDKDTLVQTIQNRMTGQK